MGQAKSRTFQDVNDGTEEKLAKGRATEPLAACTSKFGIAKGFLRKYKAERRIEDLDQGISSFRDALTLCPPGLPLHVELISRIASAVFSRYEELRIATDLEVSISLSQDALNLRPPGHPDRSNSFSFLARALKTRYKQFGDPKDLENCILLYRDALDLRPPGHPNRSSSLNDLATALRNRYKQTGNAKDLEDCILLDSEALKICPTGHPDRSTALNNLADTLSIRYDKFGDAMDLKTSISLNRDALDLRPPGHPSRASSLNNLATVLKARYDKFGDDKDLQESILYYSDALDLCPSGHRSRSCTLNNLANAVRTRFDKSGDAKDLETSISLYSDALNLCPPGHHSRSSALNNLANALKTRYCKSGKSNDLDDSISLYSDALNLCPPGHPNRSMTLTSLGVALINCLDNVQIGKLGEVSSPWHAICYFEQAASDSTSYIHYRLEGAIHWVKYARFFQHQSIFTAYIAVVQLVNRSLMFRPNVEAQQRFLASANIPRSLASDAASAAIAAGKIELAVEFLEQGRALLWSRVDAYKHPLHELRQVTGGDELADRFQAVNTKLERLSLMSGSATSKQESATEVAILNNQMQEHRVLSEEWEDLVEKARKIKGFANFLQAAPFDILQSAAAEGPVILVNISKYRSDAIILLKDRSPELVNLPEVLLRELFGQKCGSAREITSTLAYLWDNIVLPIVDRLHDLRIQKGSRIWWCPTARLCALPLHAAGRGKRNLQDLYISSYTSTLTSLIRARSNTIRLAPTIPKLLVVGQPSIDLKRVEDEVDIIKRIRHCGVNVLFGPGEATREAVLESLKDHPWVHFACHGLLGGKRQPFQASFKLHEDLHLLDLIQAKLPNAEFAFLSACHSAAGDSRTPDESIHLSAGLQFCGFKSVVGTLWEMADIDGPMLSERFYKYMFRNPDKIDFKDSAHALSSAIKDMRDAKVPMDRLAMFVHIGA